MKVSRLLFAVAAFVFAAGLSMHPVPVWAGDTDTGTIDGRVLDESKATVPGATIMAKNVRTGLTRTVTSSASGTYHIGSLPAGAYDVTVELTGFSSQVHKDVPVQVASATTLDITMKISTVAETITVTGETSLVQTTKSDVGQVITSAMVENIPLNGRKFQDLSLLVPGTRPSNYYDPTKTEVGGISYGGLTGRSVIINVDGGDNNDGVVRGLLQQFTADAIQEYKVTTQRYSAEFGRSVGGVVNVITKSGTNDFHGSVFVFARDQHLNSKSFFEDKQNIEKQPFKQQQFGGSLGGPIQKDKAHFFVAYERNRRDDFATVDTNGALPTEEGNFPKPFRNHLLTGKLDFQLGDKNSMVARYSLEDQKRDHDFIGGRTLASAGANNTNRIHSGILKDTTVLSANKVNEVLVLFQRFENNITAENPSSPGIVAPNFTAGANLNTPQQTIQKRFQIRDDFSFRKENWGGDHDFKVGAEMLRSHYGGFFTPTLYGLFKYQTNLGSDINTYLNAIPDTFSGSAGNNAFDDTWTYVGGYFQDDWKPTSKLTLNLGLRYEVQVGPYNNDFDTISRRALKAVGANADRKLDKNNVGPRVGFAYDVNGDAKAVVRGGYGLYYDEIFQNITLYEYWSQVASPTFFITLSPSASLGLPSFTPNDYKARRDAIRNSFVDANFTGQINRLTAPDLTQPYAHQANIGFSLQPTKQFAFDIDYVHSEGKGEIHRWEVNRGQNVNTRLSPAGSFTSTLPNFPQIGRIRVEGNRGHSKFDGVYVTGKIRSSKATVISTYAWSKTKNLADDFNSQPSDRSNADWERDFAPSPNDIRHRFTTGAIYQLPAGFQISTSLQGNTGKPFSARTQPNDAGTGCGPCGTRAVNPATGKIFGRNTFRTGPEVVTKEGGSGGLAFFSWDLRLSREFKFAKDKAVEVLFEVFNVTNHANFDRDDYEQLYSSPNFGKAQQIIQNSQRQAEFGVRFRF